MFFDPASFAAPVCDAPSSDRLAMFIPSLGGGGAERTMLTLLGGMVASGVAVDLVLAKAEGAFLDEVPAEVAPLRFGPPDSPKHFHVWHSIFAASARGRSFRRCSTPI